MSSLRTLSYTWLGQSLRGVCSVSPFSSRKTLPSASHVLFLPSISNSRPVKRFTEIGFRNWKNTTGTTGVLSKHANCITHKQSVIAWQQFIAAEKHQSVAEQLGMAIAEQIKKNWHYIMSIIEVLILCSKQEIAFCGHDESDTSLNKR